VFVDGRFSIRWQILSYLWILLPALFFAACTFNSEDEHFVALSPDSVDAFVTVVGGRDTIPIYYPTTVTLRVEPGNRRNYGADVFIDGGYKGRALASVNNLSFMFDPASLSNGVHDVRFKIEYSSNTGSLSDQTDIEFTYAEKSFKLLIDNDRPPRVEALTVSIEDGKLMLKWPGTAKQNFRYLVLLRKYVSGSFILKMDSIVLNERQASQFHDRDYVGGDVQYQVNVKGYNYYRRGAWIGFSCVPVEVEFAESFEQPELTYRSLLYHPDNNIQLYWTNGDLDITSPGRLTVPKTLLSIGVETDLSFTTAVKNSSSGSLKSTRVVKAYLGKRIKAFVGAGYSKEYQSFYTIRYAYGGSLNACVYRIDEASLTTTDSLVFTSAELPGFITSPDGRFGYIRTNFNRLTKIDLDNLDVVDVYNFFSDVLPGDFVDISNGNVSNNGYICFPTSEYNVVANLNDQTIMRKHNPSSPNAPYAVSSDGVNLFQAGNIYTDGTAKWSDRLSRINLTGGKFIFRKNPAAALYLKGATVYGFDLNSVPYTDGYLVPRTMTASGGVSYDVIEDRLITISSTQIRIYSPSDFSLQRTYPIRLLSGTVRLLGNHLLHFNGYVIKLPE
jgi:hypothetical protein